MFKVQNISQTSSLMESWEQQDKNKHNFCTSWLAEIGKSPSSVNAISFLQIFLIITSGRKGRLIRRHGPDFGNSLSLMQRKNS